MKTTTLTALFLTLCLVISMVGQASAQRNTYNHSVYHVESSFYPFVQVYFRTYDTSMDPLVNLNNLNIGVEVNGNQYDPLKSQYSIQSIDNIDQPVRTVLILDCSSSMSGPAFDAMKSAALRYISKKRDRDQISVIALTDNANGYEVRSDFERDPNLLALRIQELSPTATKTELYDGILAGLEKCSTALVGGSNRNEAEFVISNSIVVFSDGMDAGSSYTRSDLLQEIQRLDVRIPIYTFGFSSTAENGFNNLEALSRSSVAFYEPLVVANTVSDDTFSHIEKIQNILRNDYVLTFRAYEPVDGNEHRIVTALEYPSRSGNVQRSRPNTFYANRPILEIPAIAKAIRELNQLMPANADQNPYISRSAANESLPADLNAIYQQLDSGSGN